MMRRCPACGVENLPGEDVCANCGAPLWGLDTPEPVSIQDRLLGERLDAIGLAEPVVVAADTPLDRAIEQMKATGTDCLLVVHEGRLVGIFTERDAVLKAAGIKLEAFDVRDFMTRDPVTLRPDDTLALAIHKMAVGGFRHIPVVADGRPIGVVAAKDVFRRVLSFVA
jgi:CBS domain-containing protein